ncbi:tetratricopeptide repeat protein, partial [Candidatus Sumerlaeota bacterium]
AAGANPKLTPAWFNLGYCHQQLAIQARRKQKSSGAFYQAAVEALEQARKLDPEHPQVLKLLGDIYPKLYEFDKAVNVWYKLIEIMPDTPEAKKARSNLRDLGHDPDRKPKTRPGSTPTTSTAASSTGS